MYYANTFMCYLCLNNEKSIEKARLLCEKAKLQEEAKHPDSAIINYQSALELLENSCEYGNYKKSMLYNQKAIQTSNNKNALCYNYYSRGVLYIALHKYDSVIYYLKRSLPSESIFTQCGAYDYLYQIALATNSPDSVKYLHKYIYLNEAINVANRTPELSTAIFQQKLKQAIDRKDNEYFIWIIIALFTCCALFILYRKSFKIKLFSLQKEFATKSQIFQHELKGNKWIENYVELKALKESEEVQIVERMVQISIDCIRNLKKDPAYPNIYDLLSISAKLSAGERGLIYQMMKRYFCLYIKELSHYVPLADEDYFLCCMTLAGFSTKQCALCRGVGDTAIRVQRKRIKEKMGVYFHSEKLYDSIFGKKH